MHMYRVKKETADIWRVMAMNSGMVTGLAYSPAEHMAATVGLDGKLRVWQRTASGATPGKGGLPATIWRCLITSTYKGMSLFSSTACCATSEHQETFSH